MRIYPHIIAVLTLLLVLISPLEAGTREKRIGMFHSPKGFGISAQIDAKDGDEINTFNLYADTYGLLSGRTSDVGIAFSYTHNYILRVYDFGHCRSSFYAGAGFLCSYVHDFEKGFFSDDASRQLDKKMGYVIALDCNAGYGIDFDRGISIDVSLSLIPGVFIHREDKSGQILAGLYKQGVFGALMPQLCIYYRF